MASIHEDYKNQTMLRVSLTGGDLEQVIAEYAAKVTGCDLRADNVKVESVRVREVDRSQHRYDATADVSLVILHSPGAVDAWVDRHEQAAAERRAELPPPPPPMESEGQRIKRLRRPGLDPIRAAGLAGFVALLVAVLFFR